MLLGLICTITNTSCKKQEKENKTFMYIYTIDIKKNDFDSYMSWSDVKLYGSLNGTNQICI